MQLNLNLSAADDFRIPKSNMRAGDLELGVTFKDSLVSGAFGWYPYVEGFSAGYVRNILNKFQPSSVYDPFGGSGTTNLAAAQQGIASGFCEINPFMVFVARAKLDAQRWALKNPNQFLLDTQDYLKALAAPDFSLRAASRSLDDYHSAFPNRDFFEEQHIRELLLARDLISELSAHEHSKQLLLLACSANVVKCSNMTRRADLRRRRSDEYKNRVVDVRRHITDSVLRIQADLHAYKGQLAEASFLEYDCRHAKADNSQQYDLALTSPPYLNGTNYFRNTKLELWFSGLILSENELVSLHRQGITAGINNVSGPKPTPEMFDEVEDLLVKFNGNGDRRIPLLIRHYVSDMFQVLKTTHNLLRKGGRFILDIGDSKFYGIHVPTDWFLILAAERAGFVLKNRTTIARRYSRDKSPLVQVELEFLNI